MLHSINEIQKVYEEINSRLDDIKINSHRPSFKTRFDNVNLYRLYSVQGCKNNPNLICLIGYCQELDEHHSTRVNIGEFGWNEEWNEESSKYPFCGHSIKNFINNIVFDLRYGVANGCKNKSN